MFSIPTKFKIKKEGGGAGGEESSNHIQDQKKGWGCGEGGVLFISSYALWYYYRWCKDLTFVFQKRFLWRLNYLNLWKIVGPENKKPCFCKTYQINNAESNKIVPGEKLERLLGRKSIEINQSNIVPKQNIDGLGHIPVWKFYTRVCCLYSLLRVSDTVYKYLTTSTTQAITVPLSWTFPSLLKLFNILTIKVIQITFQKFQSLK